MIPTALRLLAPAFAALLGGVVAYVSFLLMPGTWRSERAFIAVFISIHSVMMAMLLAFVAHVEIRYNYRLDFVRVVLVALLGGLLALLVGPYPGVFLITTGRSFLSSGIAVLAYLILKNVVTRLAHA